MAWDEGLLPEQRVAAGHLGSHARLLAGPGTGKTRVMTQRACYLVEERGIDPSHILAVTFTRAAARELRDRLVGALGVARAPHVSTLHAFALRQLLLNRERLVLPQPVRIADDWEERNIILEDLRSLLGLAGIAEARRLFTELSSDWQSLTADAEDWDRRFPNPAFLGAWQDHRTVYGYTLRSELVYQLKRALEQQADFRLEPDLRYLLVDEYQDLNRCDLAVVREISRRGVEVFAAGDDDQSIYGFRKAHPAGIRRFPEDYAGASDLALTICKRCDSDILRLALFVAEQDYERVAKPIRPAEDASKGEVYLLQFDNETTEGQGVADICAHLIHSRALEPDDILILLRTDRNGAFSSVLQQALRERGLPVSAAMPSLSPLDQSAGRQLLSLLRLVVNDRDDLAWRTILQERNNGVGSVGVRAVYDYARAHVMRFSDAIFEIAESPDLLPRIGNRIREEAAAIRGILEAVGVAIRAVGDEATEADLVRFIAEAAMPATKATADAQAYLLEKAEQANARTLEELLTALEVSSENIEQELQSDAINILTMHKAKGLTAEAVIVIAAEDEYLPGRADGLAIGDERRLLYVSLTRAKHFLCITYCSQRRGQQQHTGRTSGRPARTLTRFLAGGPLRPENGETFARQLGHGP